MTDSWTLDCSYRWSGARTDRSASTRWLLGWTALSSLLSDLSERSVVCAYIGKALLLVWIFLLFQIKWGLEKSRVSSFIFRNSFCYMCYLRIIKIFSSAGWNSRQNVTLLFKIVHRKNISLVSNESWSFSLQYYTFSSNMLHSRSLPLKQSEVCLML